MKNILVIIAATMLKVISGYSQLTATLGPEVQIFPSTNQQSNLSISINKTFSSNILVSTGIGYYYTTDGGTTWNGNETLPSGLSENISTSFDATGLAYIASEETSRNVYALRKSSDEGVTWTAPHGVPETLTNDFFAGFVGVDDMPTSSNANNIYGVWTDSHTFNRFVKSNRSTDNGSTFDNMNTFGSDFGEGAKVETGPNGEVYVCWADHFSGHTPCQNISISVSTDGGVTYTAGTGIPMVGISTSTGINSDIGNTVVNDWPSMAVDKSCGPNRGRLYIAYPSNIVGGSFPPTSTLATINVTYSDNGGSSWSTPARVDITGANQSWMPFISVDDLTGLATVVYYCMDDSGVSTNTYVAYSADGTSWQNIKVSGSDHSTASIPGTSTGFAGNKIGIASYNGQTYAAWTDDRTGTWQAYVRRIEFNIPTLTSSPTNLEINSPTIITQNSNYQAGGKIEVSNTASVQVGNTANVLMIAGQSITLNPGFSTATGAVFTAEISSGISPCTTINAQSFKTSSNDWASDKSIIKKNINDTKFFVYPNPTRSIITIGTLNNNYHNVSFDISDMSGRLVSRFNNPSISSEQVRQVIDVSLYSAGVYIVTMETDSEKHFIKFIKQ